ncbi:hypothetical protein [Amycolatopsis sp. WGS_07]|uniref:hypothetical protein n=1 Tax=Amycolatopsis sp. WGS_07 TaxID=3076764 RepID=UPI003872AAA4
MYQAGLTVEVPRRRPTPGLPQTERGVVLHSGLMWHLVFFPGDPDRLADPFGLDPVRIVPTGEVIASWHLRNCDPEWVTSTWNHLSESGPGVLGAPHLVQLWELAAEAARLKTTAS